MLMPIKPLSDDALASFYQGRFVLVTGANGFAAHYLITTLIRVCSAVCGIDLQEHPRHQVIMLIQN